MPAVCADGFFIAWADVSRAIETARTEKNFMSDKETGSAMNASTRLRRNKTFIPCRPLVEHRSRLSLYVEIGDEEHNSKTDTHRKDPRLFTLVQIEYVGSIIDFLVGETHEQSTLDIDVSLVGSRALAHQTKSKPIHGREAQLRPVVEEVSLRISHVENKLTFTGKLNLPISKRKLVAGRDASRIAKHAAQYRREFPLQFFPAAEIVADPHRSRFEILVVVASFEM